MELTGGMMYKVKGIYDGKKVVLLEPLPIPPNTSVEVSVTDQYYPDSRALVKRYVAETGTDWIGHLCAVEAGNTLYTAEIAAALFRKVREGTLAVSDAQAAVTRFKADFRRRYQIVEITDELVEMAMDLVERHALRDYDAVQFGLTAQEGDYPSA